MVPTSTPAALPSRSQPMSSRPADPSRRLSTRPGPPPPAKPPHLQRLSFAQPHRPPSHVGSFDSSHQASTAFLESARESRRASTASTIKDGGGGGRTGEEQAQSPPGSSSWDEVEGEHAWALWPFEGADEGELSLVAQHARLKILSYQVASDETSSISEGWALARIPSTGEVGLIPQSYFSYADPVYRTPPTSDMLPKTVAIASPMIQPSPPAHSPTSVAPTPPPASPLQAQVTGAENALSRMVRQSLFHGRTINRFSSFVVGGAEAWIMDGVPGLGAAEGASDGDKTPTTGHHPRLRSTDSDLSEDEYRAEARARGVSQADLHFVDSGPSWKAKTPPFTIDIHSPRKRKSRVGLSEYTIYFITSRFPSEDQDLELVPEITVERRFSNFVTLARHLAKKFSGLAIPPLPEKNLTGRFSDDFVETRRGDLERWVRRVARHPVLRYSDAITAFLGMEDEEDWIKMCPALEEDYHVGPLFYANIFHPSFNIDLEDAQDAIDRFEHHVVAADRGTQSLRDTFAKMREGEKDRANLHRLFALHLLALISSKRPGDSSASTNLPSSPSSDEPDSDDEDEHRKGLLNSDGAWCFKDDCDECLSLTKAMQGAAEAIADVADLEIQHANGAFLKTQESLKDVAHPWSLYAPVVETHRTTVARYADLLAEADVPSDDPDAWISAPMEAAGRCETVLNSTLAETQQYHDSKAADFRELTAAHLDGEIAHAEAVLARLREARKAFDSPGFETLARDGPRRPSRLDDDLAQPSHALKTDLRQPSPHLQDSLVRPVTAAATSVLTDSVGSLWNALPAAGASRRLSRWLW